MIIFNLTALVSSTNVKYFLCKFGYKILFIVALIGFSISSFFLFFGVFILSSFILGISTSIQIITLSEYFFEVPQDFYFETMNFLNLFTIVVSSIVSQIMENLFGARAIFFITFLFFLGSIQLILKFIQPKDIPTMFSAEHYSITGLISKNDDIFIYLQEIFFQIAIFILIPRSNAFFILENKKVPYSLLFGSIGLTQFISSFLFNIFSNLFSSNTWAMIISLTSMVAAFLCFLNYSHKKIVFLFFLVLPFMSRISSVNFINLRKSLITSNVNNNITFFQKIGCFCITIIIYLILGNSDPIWYLIIAAIFYSLSFGLSFYLYQKQYKHEFLDILNNQELENFPIQKNEII